MEFKKIAVFVWIVYYFTNLFLFLCSFYILPFLFLCISIFQISIFLSLSVTFMCYFPFFLEKSQFLRYIKISQYNKMHETNHNMKVRTIL